MSYLIIYQDDLGNQASSAPFDTGEAHRFMQQVNDTANLTAVSVECPPSAPQWRVRDGRFHQDLTLYARVSQRFAR